MRKLSVLDQLQWEGNSHAMYRAVINAVPSLFRNQVRKEIENWVIRNHIQVVTEKTIFQAVDAIAPPGLANDRIKPALEEFLRRGVF